MMGIQQRNSSSLPLSSKQFLYWTGQERVRYPTTADMSISDYHYCPKVSTKDDGYTDRVLCRFLHSPINTTSAQHLRVSLNQSLSCNCILASISYCCNQSTSCLGQRSILILLITLSQHNEDNRIICWLRPSLGHILSPESYQAELLVSLFANGYYCSPESYQAGDTIMDNATSLYVLSKTNCVHHKLSGD